MGLNDGSLGRHGVLDVWVPRHPAAQWNLVLEKTARHLLQERVGRSRLQLVAHRVHHQLDGKIGGGPAQHLQGRVGVREARRLGRRHQPRAITHARNGEGGRSDSGAQVHDDEIVDGSEASSGANRLVSSAGREAARSMRAVAASTT